MQKMIKNQPDWDSIFNDNFEKFSNEDFSDNVIYLNGVKRYDPYPLWFRCYKVGEMQIWTIQGIVTLPDIASGQSIRVFNIPAITNKIHYMDAGSSKQSAGVFFNYDESAAGMFSAANSATNKFESQNVNFRALVICENN